MVHLEVGYMKESLGLVVPVYEGIGIDGPYLGDMVWNELEKDS
ncbi:unnamed protein product [marine sediment metagenome]|uniref:Uncharacterized protein n=1 Tax=marine sediment metagenome TaxID=412755 RepID=X1UBI8_9ZZZZ